MPGQETAPSRTNTNDQTTTALVPSQVAQPSKASARVTKNPRSRRRRRKKQTVENTTGVKHVLAQEQKHEQDQHPKDNGQPRGVEKSKSTQSTKSTTKSKKTQPKKRSGKRKRYPWRKHIKHGTVDPISLEPLISLPYPPFALAISKPYLPIPVWPQKIDKNATTAKEVSKKEDEIIRQQKILESQWGSKLSAKHDSEYNRNLNLQAPLDEEQTKSTPTNQTDTVHLFDGQVLAFYLVSQLQFIDPLNRRDLTREEIINLDEYLKRHKIKHTSVLEAYDTKGITLNTAGVSGQTRNGRAEILQQEARGLLNTLFQNNANRGNNNNNNGNSNTTNNNNSPYLQQNHENAQEESNQFSRQYAAFESSHRHGRNRRVNRSEERNAHDLFNMNQEVSHAGVLHDGGSMTIIDDNINPGLRGANQISNIVDDIPLHQSTSTGIQDLYYPQLEPFPALMTTTHNILHDKDNNSTAHKQQSENQNNEAKVVSKSLMKISKLVKKTNPKDIEKQKKAREEALRKMELSNLPYEEYLRRRDNLNSLEESQQHMISMTSSSMPIENTRCLSPTDEQLERNRNLAEALGVTPSTTRRIIPGINGGWKRPTTCDLDDFGKELKETQYPDELMQEARERMEELNKLEKKWLSFLDDDTAASCSLKKMDKPTRIFVHKYSDFWHIHTRSYDPEPRRYIHCVKMCETFAPHPLLSDAAKKWSGPTPTFMPSNSYTTNVVKDGKFKLQILDDTQQHENESSITPMHTSEPFTALKERPKLNLEPRTKPLDLPPFQSSEKAVDEKWKMKEDKKLAATLKKRKEEEKKHRILEAAFASDDEMSSSESEWDVGDAIYSGGEED